MSVSPGLVVIPARGGSQRVPRKNIRPIAGIPALAHVIARCQESGACARIVVSTDDQEIAEIARAAGADVPFLRPAALADHHTGILDVMKHAAHELNLADSSPMACVYATAVTLDSSDLAQAQAKLSEDVDFVVSVTEFDAPIQRALELLPDGRLMFLDREHAHTRSQDLPSRWHDAGQFIWGRSQAWKRASSVWDSAMGYPIAHWRVVDIDTEADWLRAEATLAAINHLTPDQ